MRPRRSGSDRRLTGRPRKAKSCTEINSGVTSNPYEFINPICSSLDWVNSVMSQPFLFS
ncbi:hypothetical protein [Priestia megaterium]|uniref:hypothetical protein n=1 Tax=Priestia megaterium TaxID=1404 RepID=UPI00285F4EA5|nr:hypothetical protein [Priestia megaterium]MDR7241350.1 hypothetical protein [Priestia megaterium]